MAVRRWQKIAADLRPSADGFAVRTSLVAGGGYAAGSQRAYSLDSCAMGQTDGRIAVSLNASHRRAGHKKARSATRVRTEASNSRRQVFYQKINGVASQLADSAITAYLTTKK